MITTVRSLLPSNDVLWGTRSKDFNIGILSKLSTPILIAHKHNNINKSRDDILHGGVHSSNLLHFDWKKNGVGDSPIYTHVQTKPKGFWNFSRFLKCMPVTDSSLTSSMTQAQSYYVPVTESAGIQRKWSPQQAWENRSQEAHRQGEQEWSQAGLGPVTSPLFLHFLFSDKKIPSYFVVLKIE